jgi:hypothetical protein
VTSAAQSVVLRARDLGKEYRLYDSPRARLASVLTGNGIAASGLGCLVEPPRPVPGRGDNGAARGR